MPAGNPEHADTFVYITVKELLGFLRRGFLTALILALAAGTGAWLLGSSRQAEFTAVALLLSIRPDSVSALPGVLPPPALDPAIYRAAVHDGPVLDELLQESGPPGRAWTRRELQERIRVLSDPTLQSTIVRVEVTDTDARVAAQLANRTAAGLISWDLARAARQISELAASAVLTPGAQLTLLREAGIPDAPANSGSAAAVALAVVLAIIVAYLLQLAVTRRPAAAGPATGLQHSGKNTSGRQQDAR
jgi:hypothetical protein